MSEFVLKYEYIALLAILVVEFLIGKGKFKSNSTIELILNIVKFIFVKEDKLELPKK